MKIPRSVFAGFLALLLNSTVVSYAQQEKRDEAARPPQQQETKPADVKPAEPLPDNSAQPDNPAQEEKRAQDENKQEGKNTGKQTQEDKKQQNQDNKQQNSNEAKRAQQEQGKQPNEQKQENRPSASGNGHNGNRTAQRIPDDKFREHFGREHHFRVSQPVIVENRPRFQYSGYWFEFVDVWPVDWSYSDDCYVDYIDGQYFLFNVLHPGVRVALVVVF